jgi:hypothetical protein
MHWLRTYAATIYGLTVLGLILGGGLLDPQYDDGGFGFFYSFVLIPVCGFMFYLPNEMLMATPLPGRLFLSIGIGLSFCLGLDYLRYRMGKGRAQHASSN